MADQDKTKAQLIEEIQALRARVALNESSAPLSPSVSIEDNPDHVAHALRESEARYRALFDGLPVGMFRTTPEGQFLDANPALVGMLRYPDQAALLATNANDLYIDPAQRQAWRTAIEQEGVVKAHLMQLQCYDGTQIWVESHVGMVRDNQGQICYEGVLKEVDERKRAEEALVASEAKYRLLVENQTDLVVEFDTNYRLTFVSPSYCEVFGKTETELLGHEFMLLIHDDDRASVAESLGQVFYPPYTGYSEERVLTNNGWRWFAWSNRAVLDEKGRITSIVAIGRDISERVQMQETAEQIRQQLQDMFDNTPAAVYAKDMNGCYIFVNRVARERMNLPASEILGKTAKALFPKLTDHLDGVWVANEVQVLESGESLTFEEYGTTTGRAYFATKFLLYDNDGNPYALCNSSIDITERKRTEDAMQRAAQQFQDMFDNTLAVVYVRDLEGRYTFVNHAWSQRTGISAEEAVGKTDLEIFAHLGETELWHPSEQQVIESGEAITIEEIGSTTGRVYLANKFLLRQADGTPYALCNSSLDITERKRTEEAMQHAAQQFQDMFDNTLAVVYVRDLEGRFMFVNRQWTETTGVSAEETVGKAVRELFPNYGHVVWDPREAQVLKSGEATTMEEIGSTTGRVYLANKFLLRQPDGTPYALCNSSIDITERKRAEESVLRAKQEFQDMFDNTPAAVYVRDLEGRYTFVNLEWCERTGIPSEEAVGKTGLELFPTHTPGQWDADEEEVLASGQTIQREQVGRTTGKTYLATKFLLREADGTPYALCNSSVDITERVEVEKSLQQYTTRLEMLREVDHGILAAQTPQAIAQVALAQLRELLCCEHATVGVFDYDTEERVLFAVDSAVELGSKVGDRHALDARWLNALQQRTPFIIDNINDFSDPPPALINLRDNGFLSLIAVPLRVQNDVLGSLNLMATQPHAFSEEFVQIACEVANQLAIALQQAQLKEQILLYAEDLE